MYKKYKDPIETKIKAALNAVETVDYYNRQYERYEELKAEKFPVCYVEFEDSLRWYNMGDGLQASETNIKLHLVVFDIADSPEPSMEQAEDLHKALHRKRLMDIATPELQLSTELMRTSSRLITKYDQLKVIVLEYATTLYDYSALTKYTQVNAGLKVSKKA